MSGFAAAIAELYAQVDAPLWAAHNLDALTDVLRDLSWLPPGPVELRLPQLDALAPDEAARLIAVLQQLASQTASGPRPVRLSLS